MVVSRIDRFGTMYLTQRLPETDTRGWVLSVSLRCSSLLVAHFSPCSGCSFSCLHDDSAAVLSFPPRLFPSALDANISTNQAKTREGGALTIVQLEASTRQLSVPKM